MGITITMRSDRSDEVLSKLESAIPTALEVVGMMAAGHASAYAPVDTGRLRGSIDYRVMDKDVYIGTNVEYAIYQEMGTRFMDAHPFLKPAVEGHTAEYVQYIKSILGG